MTSKILRDIDLLDKSLIQMILNHIEVSVTSKGSYFMDIPIVNLTFIMENESFLVRFEDEIIICS